MKKFFFNFRYFRKNAPWDSGISPPELLDFIKKNPPGRAIDLGCGTGTNIITLAQHGWQVNGIDFASRAIKTAHKKTKRAKVKADLYVDDVTKLRKIQGEFDLALDMGCFHNLEEKKEDYLSRLDEILAPKGFWLLYAHLISEEDNTSNHGISDSEIEMIATYFNLISRKDSLGKMGRNAVWALFQKK
ncbi:MAG: class I SAM-dependent methyltransferase [Anaerolineae bacterium]|nr:class I SAM-dependent methyltransferase [Anaerolineae bacterium]MBT7073363.1 class I SAM-dependent methyltransferase [Anaerolineae bacterium]MBT7781658.1 class I SAM-dependent methyltransferase [Anaerolineae bacterium]